MIMGFDAGGKMQSEKISDCFPNQEKVNDAVSLTSETVFDLLHISVGPSSFEMDF